jgi:hypothetical protein
MEHSAIRGGFTSGSPGLHPGYDGYADLRKISAAGEAYACRT